MNIKITTTHFDKTPAVEEYVLKKISSLGKFLQGEEQLLCEVELGKSTGHHKSGDIFRAEVNITPPGGAQIYAVAEESDLYAAIDVVRDEAEQAIVSSKKKRGALFKRGAQRIKNILKRLQRD
jgi:ribosomal subunit interface protein